MRKFTKLWQMLMILLISSSVLMVQAQNNASSKAPAKVELKKEFLTQYNEEQISILNETGYSEDEIVLLQKQGITVESLKDAEALQKAEEILMMNGLLNPFSFDKGENPSDAASGYTFTQSAGTYTPITGGTVVASSIPGTGTTYLDDVNYSAQAIPFTFVFNGVPYTDFNINTNGHITFGATLPTGGNYSPISSTTAYAGAASAYGKDLDGRFALQATTTSGSNVLSAIAATSFGGVVVGEEITATNIPAGTTITAFDAGAGTITMSANATVTATLHACVVYSAEIRTETLGIAPNRIHVIQYKNFKSYGTSAYGQLMNFQIRLNETTNVVEIVYGTWVGSTTSATGQVGLRGATNTDYNNRTTTTDWTATTAGASNTATCTLSTTVFPPTGRTFTFSPPLTPGDPYGPAPANLATAVLVTTNLGWSFGANTNNYDLLFGTVNPPVTVVVTNGVATNPGSYDPPGNLNYSTTYYWQVIAKNGAGNINGPVWSFTTSTNLPYAPTTPSPATLATGVSLNADLGWTFGINTETYDLFFGTVTPPVTKVVDNATAGATGTYDPGTMSYTTTYYWQVVARNAAKAETPGPIWSFTTECGPIVSLPWLEDFEGMVTVGSKILPLCWGYENVVGTSGPYSSATTGSYYGPHSGTKFLYTYYNNTTWIYTPGFSLTSGVSYDFSFWMMNKYITSPVDFLMDVAYGGSQNSAGMTNVLATAIVCNNSAYTEFKYTIIPAATGTYYFGVKSTSVTSTPWYLSFDDFRIEETPDCPNPTALGATNISGVSADLTWTSFSGLSDIEFGPFGFTPTGTPTDVGKTSPYTKGGLNPMTQYSFYVRDNCGGSLYSNWVGPYSFYTACATFTAPFAEHFQNTTIPNCWTMSGPQTWLFTTTWPGYGATGLTDHSGTGGSFAGVDGSGSVSIVGITLTTPLIDVSALTNPALRFFLFNNNINDASYQTLRVDLWDGAAWNNSIYYWGPTDNDPNWVEVIASIAPYTITGDVQFRFVVDKGAGSPFYDDLIIDDVYVDEGPTCPNPGSLGATNITTAQADLTWVSASGLSDIEFGTAGFTPTGTPTDAGKTSPYTKTGLSASSSYSFYVRDDCGSGDYSDWVGPFTFNTPCDSYILPYCNSFDVLTFPLCWTQGYAPAVTSDRWNVNTTNLAGGAVNEMHAAWQNVIGESWLTTPVFVVPAGGAVLSFKHFYDDYGAGLTLSVRFSNDNGATWTTGWTLISGGGDVGPETLDIPITLSGNVIVQWYMNGNHFQLDNWYVDDVCMVVPLAHDAATVSVDMAAFIAPGAVNPLATVKNNGSNSETFNVNMTITPGSYTSTQSVTLTPGASVQVTFGPWAAALGTYTINVCTQLVGDLDPSNDCKSAPVTVTNIAWTSGTGALVQSYMGTGVGYTSPTNMGYLFTIGGNTTSTLNNELSIYDVVNNTWAAGASLPVARGVAASAVVGNKVYHIGGSDGVVYQPECYVYDIATNVWSAIAPLPQALAWMKAVGYGTNYIYTVGGVDAASTVISTVYLYDIAANTWTTATSIPTPVFGGAFSLATGTRTLVYVGGADLSVITSTTYRGEIDPVNPATIVWTTGTAYPGGTMYRFDAAPWCAGKVIMGGGSPSSAWTPATPNPSYVYTPATDTWNAMPNVPTAVLGAYTGSVLLAGGQMKFILASGYTGSATTASTQILSDVCGFRVYGNVYYGNTGTTKPMATNTTVTLTPGATVPTGALGYYEITGISDGSYKLYGATTKTGGGITTADGITVARFAVGIGTLTNLQLRSADVNKSNSISTSDGILVKRRAVGLSSTWAAPVYVFDGPFGAPNPVLDGMPVTVSGSDVNKELRTICSGDVNGSFTPPAE